MTNNWGSVYPHFSVSTQQTSQKRPKSEASGNTSTKDVRSRAKTSAKTKQVQPGSEPELDTSNCNEQRSRKPRYLGKVRLTKDVVGSIVWWARDGGGGSPLGFVQVLETNGFLRYQFIHRSFEVARENPHLLNNETPNRIAAVFLDENGQSDPAWIDLKREVLIQCD